MAKVSTEIVKIYHKDIVKEFKVSVMYDDNYNFHIAIPEEFREIVHILDGSQMIDFNVRKKYKNKKDIILTTANSYEPVVSSMHKESCLDDFKKVLMFLVNKSINQRDVIIVFFNPKDLCQYNDHFYNEEHPQIGMQFGLTYAVETSVGDDKVYSIYPEGGHYEACTIRNRKEIRLWDKAATIIADTPENREALEGIYKGLILLNEKIKGFTQSPEMLLAFIESNTKLLS